MDKVKSYIEANKERFISELFDLLRIPSISAQSEHKPDMTRCAEWLAAALAKAGADRTEVFPTEGNPVVYAEKIVDPKAKTVLVYGHYDVMPVDPRGEWRTEPFEPVIKDGRIWGRGADDDKGQLWMHAKAFEAMCATESLPCNVKFMLEGEEEIGSPSLYKFCEQNKKMLKADIILVSDTSMISMQTPSITCGLRGLAYMEVEVTGPDKDLHSGLFGGAVANPANVLTRLVAQLVDKDGRVTIPGFYDDVRELTPAERKAFNKAPFSLAGYKKSLSIGDVEGEAGYTTLERTGVRPSLDVNGIWGGYTEEGTKTVIPSKASAKISMRLVPNQDYRKISRLFEKYFRSIAPKSVKVKVKSLHGGMPYVAPTDMPAYKAAQKAIAETFGKKPLPFYSGGSIPIISGFESILGIKSLLIGFGLAEDAIHSPNESSTGAWRPSRCSTSISQRRNSAMYDEFLNFIFPLAKGAGEIQLAYFRGDDLGIETKSNAYDVVTRADKESEAYIVQAILGRYPGHGILGEEGGVMGTAGSDYRWVIDPLDGTTNYSQGLPIFSVSIALQHKGETVAGVVYAPYLGELFWASKGGGAYMKSRSGEVKRLQVSAKQTLATSVLATGFPYDKDVNPDNNSDNVARIVPYVRDIRRLGSAAYDLSCIAAGLLDGYWELDLHEWDVCAANLIVREAGGVVCDFRRNRGVSQAAGNEALVGEMLKYIR